MKKIEYTPIGIIHSEFKSPVDTPLQAQLASGYKGRIELYAEYESALSDLETFSHIILIYHFHLSKGYKPVVKPFHSDSPRGVLATRSPNRPNAVGLSVVRLERIDGRNLYVSNIDVVDGTPLLDIKPFIPTLGRQFGATLGWLADDFAGI